MSFLSSPHRPSWKTSSIATQSNTQEELPESLLGTCRLNHLDISKAVSVNEWGGWGQPLFYRLAEWMCLFFFFIQHWNYSFKRLKVLSRSIFLQKAWRTTPACKFLWISVLIYYISSYKGKYTWTTQLISMSDKETRFCCCYRAFFVCVIVFELILSVRRNCTHEISSYIKSSCIFFSHPAKVRTISNSVFYPLKGQVS